ncbi:MAG: hypothetical protein HZB26_01590 [Candidatus Hydrogenedentes bacterium]|nr:hypothetical protein [Candidatus Hydrogenedentota bacterium]
MWHERKRPAGGVKKPASGTVIVFDTVCTKCHATWLAHDYCHRLLLEVWNEARFWQVGRYVTMPDHIHLFAAPGDADYDYDGWVKYWKRLFAIRHGRRDWRFLRNQWHTRLRTGENYNQKWDYVRENPVRRGLVTNREEWPYQGEVNELNWH